VSSQSALADPAAATYLEVLQKFARHLPDMQFVVNVVDEPRVLLGKANLFSCNSLCSFVPACFRSLS